MKSSLLALLLTMSTQSFSQAFPASFKGERHFYSANSSCEEVSIPKASAQKLRNEAYSEALTSQNNRCYELYNSIRYSEHTCLFISIDGQNNLIADHRLSERLSGICIAKD